MIVKLAVVKKEMTVTADYKPSQGLREEYRIMFCEEIPWDDLSRRK
jgi:hypothetical protein